MFCDGFSESYFHHSHSHIHLLFRAELTHAHTWWYLFHSNRAIKRCNQLALAERWQHLPQTIGMSSSKLTPKWREKESGRERCEWVGGNECRRLLNNEYKFCEQMTIHVLFLMFHFVLRSVWPDSESFSLSKCSFLFASCRFRCVSVLCYLNRALIFNQMIWELCVEQCYPSLTYPT